jgi:hypothetical protein
METVLAHVVCLCIFLVLTIALVAGPPYIEAPKICDI